MNTTYHLLPDHYLENYALIRLLLGSTSAVWPTVARWCAIPKFTLVVLGLLFVLIGGVAALFRRQKLN